MGRRWARLGAGAREGLIEAGKLVGAIEHRQGLKIGWLEEVAFRPGPMDPEKLSQPAALLSETVCGRHLAQPAETG